MNSNDGFYLGTSHMIAQMIQRSLEDKSLFEGKNSIITQFKDPQNHDNFFMVKKCSMGQNGTLQTDSKEEKIFTDIPGVIGLSIKKIKDPLIVVRLFSDKKNPTPYPITGKQHSSLIDTSQIYVYHLKNKNLCWIDTEKIIFSPLES